MMVAGELRMPCGFDFRENRNDPMPIVTIQEAQSKLTELIHHLNPGDEVVITENNHPVARLVPAPEDAKRKPRQLGTLAGSVLYMAPDFDATPDDFKEYME
jgi:prevent-host-death family protein